MANDAEAQFHVLAVDDSFVDRKLIERLLKDSSYQVTTVDSGSKALELLGLKDEQKVPPSTSPDQQENEVSLIITDYSMPGMTGYDLLKKIKGSSVLKDIPVVIMSSENVPARINRCLEGGAEEFFLKPVKLSDMNKLRPHLLKGKCKDHYQQQQQQQQQQKQKQQQEERNSTFCKPWEFLFVSMIMHATISQNPTTSQKLGAIIRRSLLPCGSVDVPLWLVLLHSSVGFFHTLEPQREQISL